MKNNSIISRYESENFAEIQNCKVSLADLKKLGVTDKVLADEVYLYKIYGDEIVLKNGKLDESFDGKKSVEKINLAEKSLFDEVNQICENIENNEFDTNLEVLIRTL